MSGLYPPVETAYYAVSILHRNYCCAMWLLSRRRHGYCIMAVIETDCNVVVIETAYYAVSTGWGKNKWCYYRVFRIQGLGMGRRIPNEVAAVSR